MLDHIGFTVSDIAAAEAFYDRRAPLGVAAVMKVSAEQTGSVGFIGYGAQGRPYFWINGGAAPTARLHVALTAPDRADGGRLPPGRARRRRARQRAAGPAPALSSRLLRRLRARSPTATTSRPSATCRLRPAGRLSARRAAVRRSAQAGSRPGGKERLQTRATTRCSDSDTTRPGARD